MTYADAKAKIEASCTEPDAYRRAQEIDNRLRAWAIAQLTPVEFGYERAIISVDRNTGWVEYRDLLKTEIAAKTYAADLANNGARYVLENQYIILCDALRQALGQSAMHEKLGFEELPTMMMMLKAGNVAAYESLRDAMDMVNAALIRHDVRWWDDAVYHTQPELQDASLKILELAQ